MRLLFFFFFTVLHHVSRPLGFECCIRETAQQQPLRVKKVIQVSQAHRLPSVGLNAEVQTKLRTFIPDLKGRETVTVLQEGEAKTSQIRVFYTFKEKRSLAQKSV